MYVQEQAAAQSLATTQLKAKDAQGNPISPPFTAGSTISNLSLEININQDIVNGGSIRIDFPYSSCSYDIRDKCTNSYIASHSIWYKEHPNGWNASFPQNTNSNDNGYVWLNQEAKKKLNLTITKQAEYVFKGPRIDLAVRYSDGILAGKTIVLNLKNYRVQGVAQPFNRFYISIDPTGNRKFYEIDGEDDNTLFAVKAPAANKVMIIAKQDVVDPYEYKVNVSMLNNKTFRFYNVDQDYIGNLTLEAQDEQGRAVAIQWFNDSGTSFTIPFSAADSGVKQVDIRVPNNKNILIKTSLNDQNFYSNPINANFYDNSSYSGKKLVIGDLHVHYADTGEQITDLARPVFQAEKVANLHFASPLLKAWFEFQPHNLRQTSELFAQYLNVLLSFETNDFLLLPGFEWAQALRNHNPTTESDIGQPPIGGIIISLFL